MKTTDKIINNESRELARLKKMQNRSSGSKYFLILLILIAVVNILDEDDVGIDLVEVFDKCAVARGTE